VTSIRNKPARTAEDALLDAAQDCIVTVGLRRTRLADVANRAGVSRMTLYRRWPDMESLVADLMTREWSSVVVGALARLVTGMVKGVAALRAHPMFRRIVEVDPEVLLPYLIDRRGTSIDRMLDALVAAISEGQRDGSITTRNPGLLGRAILLAAQGFTLSIATMTDGVTEAQLDAELRLMFDRYLCAT